VRINDRCNKNMSKYVFQRITKIQKKKDEEL
jgi:hypothetical protein